jgi:putative membrane protein
MMYYRWYPMGTPGFFGTGSIVAIVFWILFVVAAVALIRALVSGARHTGSDREPDRPMEILKERFAKGEINRKEFEDRMDALRQQETK